MNQSERIEVKPGVMESKQQEKTNTLVEFFRESPLYGSDIDLERDNDYGREVHL